jgi:hypothetical protein
MTEQQTPSDAGNWAAKVDRLSVTSDQASVGYNIEGRRISGPHLGFGRLWRREYWVNLGPEIGPEELIANWKANFGDFWPKTGRFYGQMSGIKPGDVAPLEVGPNRGPRLATGIVVIYADDESFTFMTPEGHMFAGLITFSAAEVEDGTQARVNIMLRTHDPLYEAGWIALKIGEDKFWPGTLSNLALAHGVPGVQVHTSTECLDRKRLWKHWRNIKHNAAIRSMGHSMAAPFRPTQ